MNYNKVDFNKPIQKQPTRDNLVAQFLSGIGSVGSGIASGVGSALGGVGQFVEQQKQTPEGRRLLTNIIGGLTQVAGASPYVGAGIAEQSQRSYEQDIAGQQEQDRLLREQTKQYQDWLKNQALIRKYEAEAKESEASAKQKQMSPYEGYRPANVEDQKNIINDPAAISKGIVIQDETNPSNVFVKSEGQDYNRYVDQKRKETSEYKTQKTQTELLSKKIDNIVASDDVYKVLGIRKIGPFNVKRTSIAKVFGLSADQMDNLANINTISAEKFRRLFTDLRDPKTGATGFGSLSEAELKVVSDMLVNLETSQSEMQFKNNLQTLKNYIEDTATTKGNELAQSYDGIEVYTPNTSNLIGGFKLLGLE
jgi:hypothetical protein